MAYLTGQLVWIAVLIPIEVFFGVTAILLFRLTTHLLQQLKRKGGVVTTPQGGNGMLSCTHLELFGEASEALARNLLGEVTEL